MLQTSEYEVVHPAWEMYPIRAYDIDTDFGMVYGPQFGFLTDAKPLSVMLAEGSPIAVRKGTRI